MQKNQSTIAPDYPSQKTHKTIVTMEKIQKSFPGVHALDDARFDLRKGEVHALLGENGAGKSTLMKILTGVHQKDSGTITVNGSVANIHDPKSAQALGIGIVHQEFNLMHHLSVAQNIFIGREPRSKIPGLLDDKALYEKTKELLERMNLKLDPNEKVGNLSVARQQMVEIAKALSFDSEVLVMDEPTAALTESEIDELFIIIRDLRSKGVGIVYISHRLEELRKITDRVTVMRDGKYISTVDINSVTLDEIVSLMVGRDLEMTTTTIHPKISTEVVLNVDKLNAGKMVQNVSFNLHRGEILGFAGLMGAGRTEVARAIFGADKSTANEISIFGEKVVIKSPQDAIKHGIGYLSEDRKHFGVCLGMDIESNIVMANMKPYTGALTILRRSKITLEAENRIRELNIKTPSCKQRVKNLSGGNQQKVIIAKWLCRDSKILIFDEPTRGIDVGAKSEIYKLLDELAKSGTSIIMISSDLPEILRMSHRVIVMCEGRITGELLSQEATQESIMTYATKRL